eukprot:3348634-Amphidinium_carterae.3
MRTFGGLMSKDVKDGKTVTHAHTKPVTHACREHVTHAHTDRAHVVICMSTATTQVAPSTPSTNTDTVT